MTSWKQEDAQPAVNGHKSPEGPRSPAVEKGASVVEGQTVEGQDPEVTLESSALAESAVQPRPGGVDEDANSEAETLIDSPVKKREVERATEAAKVDKPARSRIGGLPVPDENDEEDESIATPVQSTEIGETRAGSGVDIDVGIDLKNEDADEDGDADADGDPDSEAGGNEMDMGSDKDDSSSELLSSTHSSDSETSSRASSRERASSEKPDRTRNGTVSPNPKKRKHRASSAGYPSKRPSTEPPKRKLVSLQSEDNLVRRDRSPSSKLRSHRRTFSTQSAFMEGAVEGAARNRRALTHFPVRDPKTGKNGWEGSDASSETTSHGHVESRRPQRGIGRSTSTPGRPPGREAKRHVNKYGFTKLAEACEQADLDLVKEWRDKDPDQIELAEFAGNKPLQIAALNGNDEVVAYLIDQGCQIDCANVDKDTPLIDAAENGHLEVVKILLNAGVDPLRQNMKGQQALDVVTNETDECDEIRAALRQAINKWNSSSAIQQRRVEEEEQRHRAGPSKELHFMARTYENLLRLVEINDRNGVREFLDARVPVDNAVIALSAKTGDQYLVNMLLAEMTEKKAHSKAEKPMLAVLGTSHFDMVKLLTELDQFKPDWTDRKNRSWARLAEERQGPNWRLEKELLQRLHDAHVQAKGGRRSSSPVTKREGSKPRRVPQEDSEDDSEDAESGPKRKNGRRLMSRKDMRAASGKPLSESEDDEEMERVSSGPNAPQPAPESEAMEVDSVMKPPGSPNQKRDGPWPSTTSVSAQPTQEAPSPDARRRSSSTRIPSDSVLPALEEKPDKKSADEVAIEKQSEAEAQFAIQEAQRLEAKMREEEAAEADAKKAEEEAQKAETERLAEETRQREAEEARQREAEEQERLAIEAARRAEEAREAEEARKRREIEKEDARRTHTSNVLATLPKALAHVLARDSAFDFQDVHDVAYLQSHFLPLFVVREDTDGPWILNIQAAPLLGKRGIELLLPRVNELEFELGFSSEWPKYAGFSTREQGHVRQVLSAMVQAEGALTADGVHDNDDHVVGMPEAGLSDFQAELKRIADRLNALKLTKDRLLSGNTIPLYLVKLSDVLANLQSPLLRDTPIEVQYFPPTARTREIASQLDRRGVESFWERINAFALHDRLSETYRGGQLVVVDESLRKPDGDVTDVLVVHEK